MASWVLMDLKAILRRLESLENLENVEGMARFGIRAKKSYGVPIPVLRSIAKEIGKDHALAQELWAIDTRETRILASLVDEMEKVTEEQMEAWVKDFDYWEIVDQVIINLFGLTPFAYEKAIMWSSRQPEFERRAAYVIMARLGIHEKQWDDERFEAFLPLIVEASTDDRPGVNKAVNWALRQIGKRNERLNKKAIDVAKKIAERDSKAARWIASDAIKELESESVRNRLKKRL